MTVPQAIILAAAIIGLSIVLSMVLAPYEISSGPALVWRLNAVTGAVELCSIAGESKPTARCH